MPRAHTRSHRTPPPCPQVCWERIPNPDMIGDGAVLWLPVKVDEPCKHYYDGDAGVWRWGEMPDLRDGTETHAPAAVVEEEPRREDWRDAEQRRRDLW